MQIALELAMPSYSVSCKVFMQSEMSKNASTITEDYYEKQYVWHCKLFRVHKNWKDTMTRKFFVTVMSVFTTLAPTLPTRSRPVSRCKALHDYMNGNHSICFSGNTWHVWFVGGNLCDGLTGPTVGELLTNWYWPPDKTQGSTQGQWHCPSKNKTFDMTKK